MNENKSIFDPEVVLPKVKRLVSSIAGFLSGHKKVFIALAVIVVIAIALTLVRGKKPNTQAAKPVTVAADINKSFEFSALDNQGKTVADKIKFKVTSVEKTNQVIVKDQIFTAKNNKLFLIANLELKNDATQSFNILPGDLVRLTYNRDEENKFAPDLHNNVVTVAAISTKTDRIGFVVPDNAKDFNLYVGEIEGKKDTIPVNFPS